MQDYQQKMEKFFVSEEKNLVGSTPGVLKPFVVHRHIKLLKHWKMAF